jgi:hypothetical protein
MDEPPPLGGGTGPNPVRLLETADDQLLDGKLAVRPAQVPQQAGAHAGERTCTLAPERNADGRWRIRRIQVEIQLDVPWSSLKHADRALAQFEDFCVVTQSVLIATWAYASSTSPVR